MEIKETRELKDDEYALLAQLVEGEKPLFVSDVDVYFITHLRDRRQVDEKRRRSTQSTL